MQLTIAIPPKLKPALKQMAIQSGKNENDVINAMIASYFEDDSDIIAIAKERLANPAPRIRVTLDEYSLEFDERALKE